MRYLIYPIERNGCCTTLSKYEVFPSISLFHPSLLFICTLFLLPLHLWVIRSLSVFVFQMATKDLDRIRLRPLSEPPLAVLFIKAGPVLVPTFLQGLTRQQSRCLISLHAQHSWVSPASPFLLPPGLSTRLPSSAAPCWAWIYWKWSKLNFWRCFSRGWEQCPASSTLKASGGRLGAGGRDAKGT